MARLRLLLPAVVLVVAVALFVPSLAASTARSPRALAVIAVLVAATVFAGRWLDRRWGRPAGIAGRSAIGALAVWFLVLPAVQQKTLVEDIPTVAAGAARPASTSVPEPVTSTTIAATAAETTEVTAPPPTTVAPRAGAPASATPPAPTPATPTTTTTTAVAAAPTTTTTTSPPPATAEPQRITTGSLSGIGHHATGTVSVFRLGDGTSIVRFEDVDIRNSPDPVLYLVPGRDRQTREGGIEVGKLKATKGTFNHTVPASFDLGQDFTVFIWCERFATPIANADQRPI